MKGPAEPKPSSFEAVFAAYVVVATFVLGYGYWRLATRQNEQDVKIEQQRQEQQAALSRLRQEADDKRAADDFEIQGISLASPHPWKLTQSGRGASASTRPGSRGATWSCSANRRQDLPLSQPRRRRGGGTCPPMRSPSRMTAGSSLVRRRFRPTSDPRRPTEMSVWAS